MYGVTGNHVFFSMFIFELRRLRIISQIRFNQVKHVFFVTVRISYPLWLVPFLECLFPPFDPPISLSINPIIFILHHCSSSKHYHQPYHSYKSKQAVAKQKKWLWNPKPKTGWWFQNCFIFASFWGKMNPFWLIFFRWVGSTTNQKPPKNPVRCSRLPGGTCGISSFVICRSFQVWRCHRSFGHVEFLRKAATERHRSTTTSGEVVASRWIPGAVKPLGRWTEKS